MQEQYALFNDVLMSAFSKEGVRLLSHGERKLAQQQWVKFFFEREVPLDDDTRIRSALAMTSDISFYQYEVSFKSTKAN